MGSSDRSRRKSAHVKPTLGPSAPIGTGKGSGTEAGAGAGGGTGLGPGPGSSRKFITVEIDDVNVTLAKRIKLGAEVQFLYRPSVVTVVWHHDRFGSVASKHQAAVRKHHPLAASIKQLLSSGQRMKAAFAAQA